MKNLLALLFCSIVLSASSQIELTTVGTDFWFGFMENANDEIPTFSVFITSQTFASGEVEIPGMGWSEAFTVTPGITTVVEIPSTAEHTNSAVVEGKGIHLTSDTPVSVYCISAMDFSSDGTRVLPSPFLDIDYVVSAYTGLVGFGGANEYMSELLIVSTQDGTEVEITPACDMLGGAQAGVTFVVQLDAGESYQLMAEDPTLDVSGTRVIATEASGECRPFAVFGGSNCPYIPTGCSACDHVFDQALPLAIWGTDYFTVPFSGADSYTYRILASQAGAQVSIDGAAPINLAAYESVEFNDVQDALWITSDNPILVTQFMEGVTCTGAGDPAMLALNATNQTMDEVTFATVVSNIIDDHYLNVVVESPAVGNVFLDGALVPPGSFIPFPTNPAYSYAQVDLTEGSHTVQCPDRFVAYVYGTGDAESYAYSTGAKAIGDLDPVVNVTCTNGQVVLQSSANYFNPWWSTADAPEDTVFVGSTFVINPPIPNELFILHGNDFVSGCEVEEFYSVESPDSLEVNILETTIDLCLYQEYTFQPEVGPPGSDYVYSWLEAGAFVVDDEENGVISPFESGYYYLDVSTLSGCSEGMDSVLVNIIGDDVTYFDATTDQDGYCEGDTVFFNAVTGINVGIDLLNNVISPAVWADTQGQGLDDICGSMSGTAMYFQGAADRYAETVDYDLSDGGLVSFAIKISDGSGACDGAEFGENVELQYSLNGGGAWTTFEILYEGVYPQFEALQIEVPAAAQSAATRFRWVQPVFTAFDEDIWMLDNVSINSFTPSGLSYTWTGAEPLSDPSIQTPYVVPTTSGWYDVQLNSTGCVLMDSVYVDLQSSFTLSVTQDTTLCVPGEVQLSAIPDVPGVFGFQWDNAATLNNQFLSNPIADLNTTTTYTVTVTSSAGCTNTANVTVDVLSLVAPTASADPQAICSGSTELTASVGGSPSDYLFSWTPAQFVDDPSAQVVTASPSTTTTFEVVATDTVNACVSTAQVTVIVNDASVDLPDDIVVCDSEGIQITYPYSSSGFESFTWNSMDLNNPNMDYPTITVPDMNEMLIVTMYDFIYDCTVVDSILVSTGSVEYNAADSLTNCPQSAVAAPITGVYSSINWTPSPNLDSSNPDVPVFSNTSSETFYYSVTDTVGCVIQDSIYVVINLLDDFEIIGDTLCDGESIVLDNPVENMNYLWNTNAVTEDLLVSAAGTYSVTVTDSAGCSISDDILVEMNLLPEFSIVGDMDLCIGEPTVLTADINTVETYEWSNGAGTISEDFNLIGTQIIWAEVVDIMGCVYRDSVDVVWNDPPPLLLTVAGAICEDTGTVVTATSTIVDYLWSTEETSNEIFVTQPDFYTVTVVDEHDCVTADSIYVEQIIFPPAQELDTFVCEGSSVMVIPEVFPEFSVSWSTGSESDTLFTSYGGTYHMILTNQNCVKKYPLDIALELNPTLALSREGYFCELDLFNDEGYTLFSTSDGTVEWMNGLVQDNVMGIYEEGEYRATAYSELGCTTHASIYVSNECIPYVYAPSAFTPDGDGLNDTYKIQVSGSLDKFEMVIYDRWGQEVFRTEDPNEPWTGSVKGGDYYAQNDVYHFVIKYEAWNNVPHLVAEKVSGSILIIR